MQNEMNIYHTNSSTVLYYTVLYRSIQTVYKKLSYRRETARQLPTWREGG